MRVPAVVYGVVIGTVALIGWLAYAWAGSRLFEPVIRHLERRRRARRLLRARPGRLIPAADALDVASLVATGRGNVRRHW